MRLDTGALLAWYRRRARDLPWRRTSDPYSILVSELMLQQTRVETVIPYYARFLERFPDAESLASAPVEEVLALWSGLGYYRRARHLHTAARRIVEAHGGRLPDDPASLRALPGIGEYTAGAVLSIAFGQPYPVLDGNVARVLTRHEALEGDPGRGSLRKRLRELATAALTGVPPGEINQALMELGAMVCRPRDPRCGQCPLAESCRAHSRGEVDRYPTPAKRPTVVEVMHPVAVVQRGSRVLLAERRGPGRLEGLLEFPGADLPAGPWLRHRLSGHLEERYGLSVEIGEELGRVRHQITHHRITCRAFAAEPSAPVRTAGRELRWVSRAEFDSAPIPAQTLKVSRLLR